MRPPSFTRSNDPFGTISSTFHAPCLIPIPSGSFTGFAIAPNPSPVALPPTTVNKPSSVPASSFIGPEQNLNSPEKFRRAVLRRFKCPFEDKMVCPFEDLGCLFTHHAGSNGADSNDLKDVPTYVCLENLVKPINSNLNSCRRFNSTAQNPFACFDGLHLTVHQLASIDFYECMNGEVIGRFFGGDAERQCGICLETVLSKPALTHRRFAILEHCSHCFCAQCTMQWRSKFGERTCPSCKTVSHRVVYHRKFTDKTEQKLILFR